MVIAKITFFLGAALFVFCSNVQAADQSSAAFVPTKFEFYLSSGYLGLGSGSSQWDLAPGFQYQFWQPWLQVGAEVTYQKITYQGSSAKNIIFQAGPTVNYESFILSLGLALKSAGADGATTTASGSAQSTDPNGFGYYFMVGKHFVLFPGFSLRPTIGVVATGKTSLVIRPFALSFNF